MTQPINIRIAFTPLTLEIIGALNTAEQTTEGIQEVLDAYNLTPTSDTTSFDGTERGLRFETTHRFGIRYADNRWQGWYDDATKFSKAMDTIVEHAIEDMQLDEVLGIDEAAAFIGIERGTLQTHRARKNFPEPDGHVGRSPYWYQDTIEEWQRNRSGRPGPRPKQ